MEIQAQTKHDRDRDAHEARDKEGIADWVRLNLDGEVREITRLERWRPQWKVSYVSANEREAKEKAVLFRGDRSIAGKQDLKFEMEVMQALEANGVRVPHIYGWSDHPKAFVIDWINTEDRAPGMLHTAIENPSTMSDERWQAMLNYMDLLAGMHAVPVARFTHIKRLSQPPETATQIALHTTERMYAVGSRMGHIDPPLKFLQFWLRRNVPLHRSRASFIAGDAGQFMSAGTEVLALLDFEIASIGDTHWDLACFRGRHPYENMGDIPALYRRYADTSGMEVDLPVVAYHTVAFLQLSAIGATFFMQPDAQGGNWIEGVLEYASITRRAYEAIAELQGITLDYSLELPEPTVKCWEDSGLQKLMFDIDRLQTSSSFETWERNLLHAIPQFLLNHARYRDWFESESIKDVNQYTGQCWDDLVSADQAVMETIDKNDAAEDEACVRMMHRRILRFSMLVAGTNPDDDNPLFHRLDPILQ
jgi:aminoglycoside phosphotransferase (APT) family kinase protein